MIMAFPPIYNGLRKKCSYESWSGQEGMHTITPDGLTDKQPVPLTVMLHGPGCDAKNGLLLLHVIADTQERSYWQLL